MNEGDFAPTDSARASVGSDDRVEQQVRVDGAPNFIGADCDSITPEMLTLVALNQQQIDSVIATVEGGVKNVQDIYPLSPLQEAMLFHHLLNRRSTTYVLSTLLEFRSQGAVSRLVSALQTVIDRHDALRTAIVWESLPKAVQVVYRRAVLHVQQMTLDPARDSLQQVRERFMSDCHSFDLRRAPLVMLHVAHGMGGTYGVLRIHHAICDHQSWDAVLADVTACLKGDRRQVPSAMPCRTYVASTLAAADASEAKAYFRSRLQRIEEPTAPFGLLNVHGDGTQVAEARQALDAELAKRVRVQAGRLGVSAARLFHAAWGLVVARTTGRYQIVFGTVLGTAERKRERERRALGLFINTLPLSLNLESVTAHGLVQQVHAELGELSIHRLTPLTVAQSCSGVGGSAPLFTSVLNYRYSVGHHVADTRVASTWTSGVRVIAHHDRTNYPVAITIDNLGEDFSLIAQAERSLDPHRLIGHLQTALDALTSALEHDPSALALNLPIMPDSEYRQVVGAFNSRSAPYPPKTLHELLEEQVLRTPEVTAVAYHDQTLTFAELNRRSNQLARYLRSRGVGTDQLVGICTGRSVEMVISIFAVWKAGAAYIPLDPEHPRERLSYVLEEAAPGVLLTRKIHRGCLPASSAAILAVDSDWCEVEGFGCEDLDLNESRPWPHHLAYVIYTSGSTGRPKGVMIEHRDVVNLWQGLERLYAGSDTCSRIALNASLTFDASVQQVVQLLSGRTLFIVPEETRLDPAAMTRFIEEQRIDGVDCTPSQLKAWIDAGLLESASSVLRLVLVGGEAIDADLWSRLSRCTPVRFFNVYGPTECTVDATAACINEDPGPPHIGRPMENRRIYILDKQGQPVPIGVIGEISIGGAGVGRGYLNRPDMTSGRFIIDSFNPEPGFRRYATGDLGRWRADGTIEYLGRNDGQVKIRGYRIELGEIEAQLARHTAVKQAVVIAREDVPGEKHLVAYVLPTNSLRPVAAGELRAYLGTELPGYMVPSAFVQMSGLPLTSSGKVDRKALPVPGPEAFVRRQHEVPTGETERRLAEIWRSLLRTARVGRKDDFFELGGHSLLVLKTLARINHAFGTSLRVADVYTHPTIQQLAERISGQTAPEEYVDLSREAELDSQLRALPGRPRTPARGILLTGATGFVGRFLLAQLLRDTDAVVYCLVRGDSQFEAAYRLRETLARWDLWREEFEHRIVPIRGDLRLPSLGADESSLDLLSREVDSIFHCATSMNHLETYAMAKPVNVDSARELLQLATRSRPKLINYVSTVSVFSSSAEGTVRLVHEGSPIDHEQHSCSSGYAASKWVGERIFMSANDRGISCNIFRLGLVWGDSQQGRYDDLQREYRILKSCLLSGYGIENYRYECSPIPVDHAARSIVFLANRHRGGKGVFHISSTKPFEDLFERCNEASGTSLQLLSHYDWICEMKRLHDEGWLLPAIPLVEFAFSLDEAAFYEHQRRARAARVRVDCTRTQRELENAGIVAPPLNDDLLKASVEDALLRDPDLLQGPGTQRRPPNHRPPNVATDMRLW